MEHLNSCNICMDHFNEDVRPRVLPCGHDLCGSCITKSIKRGSLACPQCQHSHRATTESDFPINYRVESLLSAIKHPLSPVVSQKSSRGKGEAGKKWQALFNEEKDNLKDLIATCEDMKADYLEYEHLLSQRRDEHEGCLPRIQDLIYKNQEIMKHIDGEKKRLSGILKEGEERKKCALGILCKYNSVIKTKDIIHGSDEVERCFNSLQEWKEQCERMIPNVETFTLSEKLLQQTEVALMEMSHDDEKAETDFLDLSGSSFSTVEKVQWITGKPLQVPLTELQSLSPTLLKSLKRGTIYGVQKTEGGVRFAKITLAESKIYLHYLQEMVPRAQSCIIQHGELIGSLRNDSVTAFIDLSWDGKRQGRIHVLLTPDSPQARHFTSLCTGDLGPSYANSRFLAVVQEGEATLEYVIAGDYENNDGSGGAALFTTHTSIEDMPMEKLEAGALWQVHGLKNEQKTSQFAIAIGDGTQIEQCSFGRILEGLEVVKAATHYRDIREVIISDCGVLIPI